MRILAIAVLVSLGLLAGCSEEENADVKKLSVTIDWVPSPEYYGFFYAKKHGLYRDAKLDVTINYGSGAPMVASQLAVNSILFGTTTSDNILRQVARGANFGRAIPLNRFNPASLVWVKPKDFSDIRNIAKHTIGTNQQSGVYTQFKFLLKKNKISSGAFAEFPIGWGGAAQLRTGDIDAFLAYTTNAAVDAELMHDAGTVRELMFADQDIFTYGLVLVVASKEALEKQGYTTGIVEKFFQTTLEGYRRGGEDIPGAIAALKEVEPTLNSKKLEIAIRKIQKLNKLPPYPPDKVDAWVEGFNIDDAAREKTRNLYLNAPVN